MEKTYLISVRNNDFGSDSTKAIAKIGFNGKFYQVEYYRPYEGGTNYIWDQETGFADQLLNKNLEEAREWAANFFEDAEHCAYLAIIGEEENCFSFPDKDEYAFINASRIPEKGGLQILQEPMTLDKVFRNMSVAMRAFLEAFKSGESVRTSIALAEVARCRQCDQDEKNGMPFGFATGEFKTALEKIGYYKSLVSYYSGSGTRYYLVNSNDQWEVAARSTEDDEFNSSWLEFEYVYQ
jgi:hypothetical protein